MDLQVYANMAPADYGVQVNGSTCLITLVVLNCHADCLHASCASLPTTPVMPHALIALTALLPLSDLKLKHAHGCVQVGDTTFEIIRENAAQLKRLAGQQPPRAACKVGCWVPQSHSGTFSTVNRCGFSFQPSATACLQPNPPVLYSTHIVLQ